MCDAQQQFLKGALKMSDNFENNNGFDNENQDQNQQQSSFETQDNSSSQGFLYGQDDFANNTQQQNTPPYQQYSQPSQPYNFNSNNYSYTSGTPNNSQNGYNYQNQYNYSAPTPTPPKKKSSGKKVVTIILVLAVVIGLAAAVISLFGSQSTPEIETTVVEQNSEISSSNSQQTVNIDTTNSSNTENMTGVEVAKKARPSVVGVMTYSDGQLSGEGSGVVMGLDSTGKYTYIITCAHVISEKGVTYGILTLDEKRYEATLVAYDTRTDIGVLKVEATDLPAAEFGDSSSLQVGETIYAIGNPGGSEYFGSMTNGIVSAIDRSISSTYTMTCIQHNAAINPGNSGGALVNSAGQVVGINSSKIAATDYEGMGFAVPTSIFKPVVESLIEYGYVPNRPKLGIEYASVNSYQLYSMVVAIKGLPAGSLVIAGISEDSTLAGTQAQVGDLIIAVNGKEMTTSDVLLDLINTGAVGDTITLTLCRVENRTYKTSTFDVTITLVEDKGSTEEEETTTYEASDGYNHGGASSFEDFFEDYFGF